MHLCVYIYIYILYAYVYAGALVETYLETVGELSQVTPPQKKYSATQTILI